MIRRRRTSLLALAALAAAVAPAGAASLATYQLKNTGTATVSQVLADISPAGSVFAPASAQQSPLTVLSGSGGFKADALTVAIGTGKLANGDPLQVLNLQFDKGTGTGLAPGGVVNFSLNLGSSSAGPSPSLILEDPTTGLSPAGLSLLPFTPPTTSPGSGSGGAKPPTTVPPPPTVPEPVSLALWSVAAGLGLLRARIFRRARRPEV